MQLKVGNINKLSTNVQSIEAALKYNKNIKL